MLINLEDLYSDEWGYASATANGDPLAYKDADGTLYCSVCATENKDVITEFDDAVINEECGICDAEIGHDD